MKSILKILILVFNIQISFCQIVKDTIDFESPISELIIDTTNNQWEVGAPSKNLFNAAHSGENVIITSTKNFYIVNDTSFFIIKLKRPEIYVGLNFSFWHKYDTDTLNDFGYLEFSYDGGESWIVAEDNLLHFVDSSCEFKAELDHGRVGPTTLYSTPSTFISGNMDVWIQEYYNWLWFMSVKKKSISIYEDCLPDSIFLKFVFISDSIQNEKEGWMIDDIIYWWEEDIGGSVEDIQNNIVEIYPNPFNNNIEIDLYNSIIMDIEIHDIQGRAIHKFNNINCKNHVLNLHDLNKGMYFIIVKNNSNNKIVKKIIKN